MPRAVALMCVLPLVGKIYNYFDPRWLIIFGITVVCVSYFQLAHLATTAGAGQYYPDPSFDGFRDAVYFCFINDGML